MMNLLCLPAGVVLTCSDCGDRWPVHEGQPFVAQLRLAALGHDCPARASTDELGRSARRPRLHLVTDA